METVRKLAILNLNVANAEYLGFTDQLRHNFPEAATVWEAQKYMAALLGVRPTCIKLWHDSCWVEKDWLLEDFWDAPLKLNVDLLCDVCDHSIVEAKDLQLIASRNKDFQDVVCELCTEIQQLADEVKKLGAYKYDQKIVVLQAVRLARNAVKLVQG